MVRHKKWEEGRESPGGLVLNSSHPAVAGSPLSGGISALPQFVSRRGVARSASISGKSEIFYHEARRAQELKKKGLGNLMKHGILTIYFRGVTMPFLEKLQQNRETLLTQIQSDQENEVTQPGRLVRLMMETNSLVPLSEYSEFFKTWQKMTPEEQYFCMLGVVSDSEYAKRAALLTQGKEDSNQDQIKVITQELLKTWSLCLYLTDLYLAVLDFNS